MLYGATGYTGALIAREAARLNFKPIIAGRSAQKVRALASELGCDSAVFALDDHTAMLSSMQGVSAVLNCAGPFSATAATLMQACLAMHAHYFDITGEIDVFELAHSLHDKAVRAGSILCPGVGFDVVPTDCVAATLKAALPDATHLALGFEGGARMSRGTAKTMIETMATGSRVRRDGRIESIPHGERTRRIDFGNGERLAMTIPWGDVSTAFHTTGIANIEVYSVTSEHRLEKVRRLNRFRGLARSRLVQYVMKKAVDRQPAGPDETERANNPTYVWGEVTNAAGTRKVARVRTANGYQVTIYAALGIVHDTLEHTASAGFSTPTMLVGAQYVSTLPGSSPIRVSES
jgi:short subunit dehydrogenase-like uncharacterized protein